MTEAVAQARAANDHTSHAVTHRSLYCAQGKNPSVFIQIFPFIGYKIKTEESAFAAHCPGPACGPVTNEGRVFSQHCVRVCICMQGVSMCASPGRGEYVYVCSINPLLCSPSRLYQDKLYSQ